MSKTEEILLDTQSFRLTLNPNTYELLQINVHDEDVAGLYEDDKSGLTIALIRELSMNLQASKEIILESDELLDKIHEKNKKEVSELDEIIDNLTEENAQLRSDNETLRDELDDAQQ